MKGTRDVVVITGGGSGIGRGLVHHFSRDHRVVTCGRRATALEETKSRAPSPGAITIVQCDIGTNKGREALLAAVPKEPLRLLVHNAAIGDPGLLADVDVRHFEDALAVNVVAPLALSQALLPQLKGGGRILHLGTSVAFNPQRGTNTYGVTKMAFHRLFQQMNVEGTGVPCGSLSPGLVDTEGVRDHVSKARLLDLPHVAFFDKAFEKSLTTPLDQLMALVDHLLSMEDAEFTSREWRFSEWRQQVAKADDSPSASGRSAWRENMSTLAILAASVAFAYGVHLVHAKL